jgi:ankyrin repeat protein
LSIAELADAIAINVEDQDEPFFDVHLELFDIEAFLDSCSSLLTTHRNVDDAKHDQKVFIKFAHFSILEFLRSDALNGDTRAKLTLEGGLLHSMLAKSCLVYIHQFSADDTGDTAPLPVFMRYAASSWLKHKQLSHDEHWALPSAQQMLQAMFDAESSSYNSWLKYSSIDKHWEYDNWTMRSWDAATQQVKITRSQPYARPTPVYCAAFAGLTDVTTKILDSGADPNVKCGIYAYALQAAAACGHIDIVKHLVAAGADLDADGGKSGSAIAAASTAGHAAIVRILLEAGAKPQRTRHGLSDRNDDPLFMAAIGGHLDVVNLLLDYGAEDLHEMKGTALSAAIQTGRLDIVRAMLRHERIRYTNQSAINGIIKPKSSGLNQGLFYAASLGHKDILRELANELTDAEMLRYAARAGDENLLSDAMARLTNFEEEGEISDHPRALQSAAIGGHLSIVKKLLASGADPNLKSNYSTALDASVHGGNLDIARTLIEAGANVNSDWPRPLLTAMSAGRRDFMELFVSHGADTYACLLSAVKSGEFRNFNNLIELGADIHRCDPDSDISLLQAAAFGGSVNIVRYLLDHGLELEDATQTHPLTEAIRSGHVPAAKFLLDRGANVNAPPSSHQDPGSWGGTVIHGNCWPPSAAYDTPLSAAIRTKNSELARRLLDMGALSDPQLPKTCGTPLLFAVWEEDVDIVHMLLEKGAPPNQPGSILQRKKLSYPVLLATEKGNIKILTALLAAGASVNQQDAKGFSAAHVAAGCPNASCLRTLVCDHQADITLRLQNGSQPIHSAASRGDVERVQILADAGADINSQNDRGRTPLHWAADAENCEVVELLLDLGADVTVTADDGGVTAWDLMCLAAEKPWYSKRKERGDEEKVNERVEKLRKVLREAMVVQEMNAKAKGDDGDGLVAGHSDECTRVLDKS